MIDQQMLAVIWDIDPLVFDNFPYLRWYSICWGCGLFLAILAMQYMYQNDGKSEAELSTLTIYLVIGIIVGARMGHVLFYEPNYYWNNPIEILPIRTDPDLQFIGFYGLASHGGVIGALISIGLYIRRHGGALLWLLDRVIIAGALLGAFIRLGNLFNSEILGTVTHIPWAFVFQQVDTLPRHPSQLYEALAYLLIFTLLFILWKRRIFDTNGQLFGIGLALVFGARFFIEFLKIDQVAFEGTMLLNMGQKLSIPLIVVGVALLTKKRATFHAANAQKRSQT